MKKLTLILSLIIVLSVGSNAQDTTFNKLVKSYPGTLGIRSIVRADNYYYVFISQVDTPYISGIGYKNAYGILKLNSNYSIVDSNLINVGKTIVANNGHGFDINKLDTTFIYAGNIKIPNSSKENGYLVKFDKNLDTLWTLEIPHPDTACADTSATPWVALRDVKVTPSGDYIIVGNYNYHCQGNRNRSFIIKMDSEGEVLYYKQNPLSIASKINEIDIDPNDSGLCFVSYINSDMRFSKLDKHANFSWSSSYINKPNPTIITSNKIIDNKIIIASANWDTPPSSDSKLVLSVSSINKQTHSLSWEKTYYSINIKSNWLNQETLDIEITPNGNIAIGSVGRKNTGNHFTTDFRAQILMLNSNGDSLWSRYYTYNDNSMGAEDMQFNDMVVCPDGGFLFGGDRAYNAQFLDAWLVKTDSMGYCPYAYTVGIEHNELIISKNKLSVFPNPARDNINFRFSRNLNKNIKLSIYSASGTLVKQQKLNEFDFEYRVNIGELSTGIYFVSMEVEGKIVGSGKFVKE